MYSRATAKKWLYDLFPWRRIARRFRAPLFRPEEDVVYRDPLSSVPTNSAPVVQEIYEEQVLSGFGYSLLPDPYELPQQQFDGMQGILTPSLLNPPQKGLASTLLEEVPLPQENPEVLEINTAINEATGLPSPGMESGLEGSLDNPLGGPPPMEMDLEQRLNDPFMNPLFDPLRGPFNPFGPGF